MYIDLKFTVINEEGKEVTCQILSILPMGGNDFYVIFTDGKLDSDGIPIFQYGKMLEVDGEYELKGKVTEEEFEMIKSHFANEIETLVSRYRE